MQVGHPVAHDEVVDLLRSEDLIDDACRTLHICPKPRELFWREFRHVDDVFPKDHEAVSSVVLIPSEPYVTRAGCRDEALCSFVGKCASAHMPHCSAAVSASHSSSDHHMAPTVNDQLQPSLETGQS